MQKEKWKKIKNWPYKVSNLGRVKSIERYVKAYLRRGTEVVFTKKKIKSIVMKQTTHKNGYIFITLKNNGLIKTFSVHRLVMRSFKPINDNMHVNHLNLNKSDNRLENLEWVTMSENMKHAVKNGRMHTEAHMRRYKNLIGNKYALGNRGNRSGKLEKFEEANLDQIACKINGKKPTQATTTNKGSK